MIIPILVCGVVAYGTIAAKIGSGFRLLKYTVARKPHPTNTMRNNFNMAFANLQQYNA